MILANVMTKDGPRLIAGGKALPVGTSLSHLFAEPQSKMHTVLGSGEETNPQFLRLAPIDPYQEVWASGVTYARSRSEREAESTVADVYAKVYDAERPEIFFKMIGWRTQGSQQSIRIRNDSTWNVPEPELVLVINSHREIIGYTAGNDVSSRSIEGENPLYLPQAKTYNGSCAIGSAIKLCSVDEMRDLPISIRIDRGDQTVFEESITTAAMHRTLEELAEFLTRELSFPFGVFLMTGTGIVPSFPFTLMHNDIVIIRVGEIELTNTVAPE
jgi:2-dehydro-3-deoxy-D-arabinonate dehydratase